MFMYTVKHIYKGQPLGTTKVAFVDRWPLFRALETTYPLFIGQIKNGLCEQETMSLCTDFTVIEFVFKLRKEHVFFDFSLYI